MPSDQPDPETLVENENVENDDLEAVENLSAVNAMAMTASSSSGESEGADNGIPMPTASTTLFSGAATASIPILIPPGRTGLQPNISLTYNSYQKNGWIGMGWDINMGAIQRSTKRGVDYSANDFKVIMANSPGNLPSESEHQGLMGDNSDLLPRPEWGANYYGAKIEGAYTKYFYDTDNKKWVATDKFGKKYQFGTTADSRQDDPNDSNRIFKWCLDKIVDTNGNYIEISYAKHNGQIYLKQIDYTGNQGSPPLAASNYVRFYLENERTDVEKNYKSNFEIRTNKRLKTIEVQSHEGLVRAYKLTYAYSEKTSRSELTDITHYGHDALIDGGTVDSGSALPPIFFQYNEEKYGFLDYQNIGNSYGMSVNQFCFKFIIDC